MKLKLGVFLGWLGFAHGGSFAQDVMRPSLRTGRAQQQKRAMENELLSRAVPLSEYKKMLEDHGLSMPDRDLQEQNNQQNDFYLDDDVMYSFTGYAIKYATCQPVQYFSEDAIRAGEHSPMLTQDIVILRLCPINVCSSHTKYGCHYNFAEYALTLSDYLQVMLQFRSYQRDNVCEWCEQCSYNGYNLNQYEDDGNDNGRRLEDDGKQDGNAQENNNGEQPQEEDNQDNNEEHNNNEQNDGANQENNANQNNNGNGENNDQANNKNQNNNANQNEVQGCDKYFDTYCSDYASTCVNNNQEGGNEDSSSYVNYNLYLGYLDCTEAEYNGYAYFVRPRCDGNENTIKMAVYYDQYCVQSADGVNIRSLGLGFHQSIFEEFYSPDCIDCSESQYPPYFDTGSAFCNNLHYASAKCTEDLMYDLFDGESDQSSECTFIEGIRFGAYDSSGSLSTVQSSSVWNAEASSMQTIMVAISLGTVIFFIVYACYLHHAMTNLLIKSLSHRELLPASRQQRRRQAGDNSVATAKRRPSNDSDDWNPTKPV